MPAINMASVYCLALCRCTLHMPHLHASCIHACRGAMKTTVRDCKKKKLILISTSWMEMQMKRATTSNQPERGREGINLYQLETGDRGGGPWAIREMTAHRSQARDKVGVQVLWHLAGRTRRGPRGSRSGGGDGEAGGPRGARRAGHRLQHGDGDGGGKGEEDPEASQRRRWVLQSLSRCAAYALCAE